MMCTVDELGLRCAVTLVQYALITTYENNCPLRLFKSARNSLRWAARLEIIRREVSRL
jgi:hypothetical protein